MSRRTLVLFFVLTVLVLFADGFGGPQGQFKCGLAAPTGGKLNAAVAAGEGFVNSVGMKLIRIEQGSFQMGSNLPRDYWDERPVHKVTISKPFYMSETEVTIEQFRQFRPDFQPTGGIGPHVAGVSWYDAVEFCKWLSEKEGIPYRLGTEAEWEYACRAGTTTLYSSGDEAPTEGYANPWGLKNMHTGVREWCWDFYGQYVEGDQVDPVGPEKGLTKVVRGGPLDNANSDGTKNIFNASASRASIAPLFGLYPPQGDNSNKDERPGLHKIGFRVVQGPMPTTMPGIEQVSYSRQGIKKNSGLTKIGPPKDKPYFRKRYLLPTPLENSKNEEIDAVGMHPSFRRHCHSPGLEVCPNGDVLMIIYTSYSEYEPGVSLIASRLRFGADQWDMPEKLFNFAAVNDHCPMPWTEGRLQPQLNAPEGATIYFFWGNPRLDGGFPFQWTTSNDNGATWDEVKFPNFITEIHPHSRQPINTALRDKNGTMYLSSDGAGGKSVLWVSRDNGKTWRDPVGRSGGRHTTFALSSDGTTIIGMGGKNTDIDGYMPKSISKDGGKTWEVVKTRFGAQGSNQRPIIIRLQSGRLFFAADFQHISGRKPDDITAPKGHLNVAEATGSFVALSDDDGENWHVKKLVGTQQHESPSRHKGADTIGYSTARQAPNGMIHLITTMNRPCLHFELNEAWILQDELDKRSDEQLMQPTAKVISGVKKYQENYHSGKVKTTWYAGIADDGRYLLHGEEKWRYENGQIQREATYNLGNKVKTETYWALDGTKLWQWHYRDGPYRANIDAATAASDLWTQYWPNGKKKAESTWLNFKCNGTATLWDSSGNVISSKKFTEGKMLD